MTDNDFILRCLQIAKLGGKATNANPNVGAIIVKNGKIIGEGYHKKYGSKHAEVEALENVPQALKQEIVGATMYVSLEPCVHHGKTPPCSERIIIEKISRVVICSEDPNPKVFHKGIDSMRNAGLEVEYGVLGEMGSELLRKFIANLSKKPYIILKIVQSADGYIGCRDYQIWMSNKYSRTLSHKWRDEVDGIMIGTKTALTDNPSLTTRLWPGDNPVRIVWDRKLKVPKDYNIYNGDAASIILNEEKEEIVENITYINTSGSALSEINERLFLSGITSLLVEGGSETIQSYYSENLWDEARIITTTRHLVEEKHCDLIKAVKVNGIIKSEEKYGDDLVTIMLNATNKVEKS